jgi:hypothetical protein
MNRTTLAVLIGAIGFTFAGCAELELIVRPVPDALSRGGGRVNKPPLVNPDRQPRVTYPEHSRPDKSAKSRVEKADAFGKDKNQERIDQTRRSETIGTRERFR